MSKAAELANLIGNINAGGGGVNRNIIINGAMNVAQRGTSQTGISNSGYYVCDRWRIASSATDGRATMTQDSSAPEGFANSTKLACTTADTSIASGELFNLSQLIEGQNLQTLKKGTSSAVPVTASFYVKGNASATYTVELEDRDNTRYNSQEFPVTTDWVRVSRTFVADTTGTLDDDNAQSFRLNFWLHGGSTYTGGTHTDNVWHTTANQRIGDSQTSFFDSTDRTFFLTGVQLEVGQNATEFEHEPFERTLAKCQRYFQNAARGVNANEHIADSMGHAENTTRVDFIISLHPNMRATPSVTLVGNFIFRENGSNRSVTSINLNGASMDRRLWIESTTSGHTDEASGRLYTDGTNVGITIDAEL